MTTLRVSTQPTLLPSTVNLQPQLLERSSADNLFVLLRDNLPWGPGIRTRHGSTRMAYQCDGNGVLDDVILGTLQTVLHQVNLGGSYALAGVYINYYRNGNDWTPTHTHKDTLQLIISLGATRTLKIRSTNHSLNSGDVIVFGAVPHGVPREPAVSEGRISIATFLVPLARA